MKDITTIIFRLTVSCLLAGLVMGTAFVFTNKAKLHNAHVNEQRAMLGLLGYSKDKPAPSSLTMHEIYRYIVSDGEALSLGYLVPVEYGEKNGYSFVSIALDGKFLKRQPIDIAEEKVTVEGERDKAILAALDNGKSIRFADQTSIVTNNGRRTAYLLPGEFPGFKTFVKVILAIDPAFTILGLEIMEHEEDPGLGGEIVQDYFKKQFRGKPFDVLKTLDVVKRPIPEEYLRVLEADKNGITLEDVTRMQEQYKDNNIYALTGATISSRSVTNGVKAIVKKFAYRISILDRVLREQNIAVPF
jgi:electron transport complex protein RnfG